MGAALGAVASLALPVTPQLPAQLPLPALPSLPWPAASAAPWPAAAAPRSAAAGRPVAPSADIEKMVMGELNKISSAAKFKQRMEQVQYWRSFTEPLMYLGMNNTGEFPVVPNQMSWWMKGNPFDVWADPINGPVTSESHTCFGLMQTWQAVCSAGPWYRRPLYDPRGSSGPEADEDNSCGRLMEQYTRMCHRPANSMHEMSAIA